MSMIELISKFSFYGIDVTMLAIATSLIVQLCKFTLLRRVQKKILTFLPFFVGTVLYAAYMAVYHQNWHYPIDEYVAVMEHGFAVGTAATLAYVAYEQFVRPEKKVPLAQGVVQTLIEGYVPQKQVASVAQQVAVAIEQDVTGNGAQKAANVLMQYVTDDVSEQDVQVLARLIVETLAHLGTKQI